MESGNPETTVVQTGQELQVVDGQEIPELISADGQIMEHLPVLQTVPSIALSSKFSSPHRLLTSFVDFGIL